MFVRIRCDFSISTLLIRTDLMWCFDNGMNFHYLFIDLSSNCVHLKCAQTKNMFRFYLRQFLLQSVLLIRKVHLNSFCWTQCSFSRANLCCIVRMERDRDTYKDISCRTAAWTKACICSAVFRFPSDCVFFNWISLKSRQNQFIQSIVTKWLKWL